MKLMLFLSFSLFIFLTLFSTNVLALSTGWLNATSNLALKGGGIQNPVNAYTDDAQYARMNSTASATAYYGFSPNIPAGSTIQGIEVKTHANASTNTGTNTFRVMLSNNSGSTYSGTIVTPIADYGATAEVDTINGSANDLWGLTWTVTNANNIRINVTSATSSTTRYVYLEWIAINITYAPAGTQYNFTSSLSVSNTISNIRTYNTKKLSSLSLTNSISSTRKYNTTRTNDLSMSNTISSIKSYIINRQSSTSITNSINSIRTYNATRENILNLIEQINSVRLYNGTRIDSLSITNTIGSIKTYSAVRSSILDLVNQIDSLRKYNATRTNSFSLSTSINNIRRLIYNRLSHSELVNRINSLLNHTTNGIPLSPPSQPTGGGYIFLSNQHIFDLVNLTIIDINYDSIKTSFQIIDKNDNPDPVDVIIHEKIFSIEKNYNIIDVTHTEKTHSMTTNITSVLKSILPFEDGDYEYIVEISIPNEISYAKGSVKFKVDKGALFSMEKPIYINFSMSTTYMALILLVVVIIFIISIIFVRKRRGKKKYM